MLKEAAAANNHAQAATPLKEADLAEDESDSDSSSSSSSDKRKKKERKNKRKAKTYKDKSKKEKQLKLEFQARYTFCMRRAKAIHPFIMSIKASLEDHLREIGSTPTPIVDPLQERFGQLKGTERLFMQVIKDTRNEKDKRIMLTTLTQLVSASGEQQYQLDLPAVDWRPSRSTMF